MGRSFHEKILALYKRKHNRASRKKTEEAIRDKKLRCERQTEALMGPPPYKMGSKLAKQAVQTIEQELLKHAKEGNIMVTFGHSVLFDPNRVDYPDVPVDFPGWPNPWPKGTTKRIIRNYAQNCTEQIYMAFIIAHPEWEDLIDYDLIRFPLVTFETRFDTHLRFWWAPEKK